MARFKRSLKPNRLRRAPRTKHQRARRCSHCQQESLNVFACMRCHRHACSPCYNSAEAVCADCLSTMSRMAVLAVRARRGRVFSEQDFDHMSARCRENGDWTSDDGEVYCFQAAFFTYYSSPESIAAVINGWRRDDDDETHTQLHVVEWPRGYKLPALMPSLCECSLAKCRMCAASEADGFMASRCALTAN